MAVVPIIVSLFIVIQRKPLFRRRSNHEKGTLARLYDFQLFHAGCRFVRGVLPDLLDLRGAFKTQVEYYQSGLSLPDNFFNFENFKRVIDIGDLGLGFRNILIVLVISVVGNILFGTMVAYAVGRFEFKMKKAIMGMYLVAQVIPMVTTQVATFSVIQSLGPTTRCLRRFCCTWGRRAPNRHLSAIREQHPAGSG